MAYKAWLYWGKKPPNIVRTYVENYCPSGGVVMDPFLGSGVTALEAADTGRRAIGVDINPVGLYLAEDLLRPLDLDAFDAAVGDLSGTIDFVDSLFVTTQTCDTCSKSFSTPAICFHWKSNSPFAVRAECPSCGQNHTYKPSADDLDLAAWFEGHDAVSEWSLWAPDVDLGYGATAPFEKVGGQTTPKLRAYYTGRNWFALAVLRSQIVRVKQPRIRQALLSMLATFLHLSSAMMMVRETRPDSSSLARQAYWLPNIFMEVEPSQPPSTPTYPPPGLPKWPKGCQQEVRAG